MQRYFIELAYKGTNFNGWQVQPNAPSVQATIEEALSTILRSEIKLTGCGRTDTGVHAKYYVAHFDYEKAILSIEHLAHKLNSYLAYDIVIYSITPVGEDAHARFKARERAYEYHLCFQKDPFLKETVYFCPYKLDFELMNQAAALLKGHQDFTSFSKLHTDVKTNNCKISKAEWISENSDYYIFCIKADRFLRNMVRAIVGTLLEVGRNRISVAQFEDIILQKDRGKAGVSVPGHALFLSDVVYPDNVFKRTIE